MKNYEDSKFFPDCAHRLEFSRLEFLDIYLFNMERLLEEDIVKVKQTYGHILNAKEDAVMRHEEAQFTGGDHLSYSEIERHYEIEEITMNNISTELFYPSFFISLYADFEKSLLKVCDEFRDTNQRLTVQDIHGNGIHRSKTYLVKVLGINEKFFGNTRDWSQIINYGKLRNHLVHDDRKIPYIENSAIKFTHEDDPQLQSLSENENLVWVNIDKEFCSEAINVIGNYWVSLFRELSKLFTI
jgi:hypothetical protein